MGDPAIISFLHAARKHKGKAAAAIEMLVSYDVKRMR